MPLQTSGAISLNDIHVEAGGTSGTTATINDSDIRALISKSSGATMSFNEWYGASASTVVTLGQGSSGSGASGFLRGSYGTVSTNLTGATIYTTVFLSSFSKSDGTTYSFIVQLFNNNQNLGQSFFSSIQESSLGTLNTSAATYDTAYAGSDLTSRWTWSLSSAPSNWDGSGNLTVTYSY